MHGLLKQPGYRLYSPDSPEAGALLAEQGLSPADLDRALAHLERTEGTTVRAILGINEDGVFGVTRAGSQRDLPDSWHERFIPLLWLKVHELLGRVPEGSTARFVKDDTRCWAKPRAAPPSTGRPAEASTRSTDRHRLYATAASTRRRSLRSSTPGETVPNSDYATSSPRIVPWEP